MEDVTEIFLPVFWFATSVMIAGQKISASYLGSLALLRMFICHEIIILVLKTPIKEPRGFGFVQYVDPADAADAKYHMDGQVLLGRELTVVFAEENRKKPTEMRARERFRGRAYDRRRSPLRYSRSPRSARSYSRSPDYYSPSPRRGRYSRYRKRSYSRSPYGSRSTSRSRSRSPIRSHRSWSQGLSRSPEGYSRDSVVLPAEKHGDAAMEDVKASPLLLHHSNTPFSKSRGRGGGRRPMIACARH
ncbi:hypothetical protein F0562_015787 [Nyssa sinensis]|uniref:RRM domain-containing protein n=1 Tax=Nyssa sinensis TaxID=561372 RepID=A0A5J4ZI73_9ASTE|nr:hypothetical protein F0562_015787 [Nyssa sinensis]